MRRKTGTASETKEKGSGSSRMREEQEFLILLCYLRRSPRIVQDVFTPYVRAMADHYVSNTTIGVMIDRLKLNTKCKGKLDEKHIQLFENVVVMVNFNDLALRMVQMRGQIFDKERKDPEAITSYDCPPFPINLVRPKYYLTEVVAKQEAQIDLGVRTQNLKDNSSPLYADPRFYEKLNELVHFKNNRKFKGAVLMLEYAGHGICGGRAYAVLNGGSVQVWEMSSHIFPFPFASTPQSQDEEDSIKSGHIEEPVFGKKYKFIAHDDKVTCASFSSDEFYLITGGVDKKVKLWCLRLKILLAEYRSHTKTVWDVHFNPSGYYFLSGAADGLMILWRTDTAFSQRVLDHGSDVYKVSFAKNPSFAVSVGEDCRIKVWHLVEAQVKYCLQLDNPVLNFTLGHSGIYIAAVQSDGRVTIFNLLQGVMITTFYFYAKKVKQSNQCRVPIHDVCFSEDERELTCVTGQHVLIYAMEVLESKRKINVFEKSSRAAGSERNVTPRQIIMISGNRRLTFCGYRDYRLLIVGASLR